MRVDVSAEMPPNLQDRVSDNDSVRGGEFEGGIEKLAAFSQTFEPQHELMETARSSLTSIGELAAGEDSDALANALFGDLPAAGSLAEMDLDTVMSMLAELGTDVKSKSDFEMPRIIVVGVEDPLNSLPSDTLGAFVPGIDGERGTIMIAEKLLDADVLPGGETLESVMLEEVGEAVAEFASEYLVSMDSELSVAKGDVGDRIETVVIGGVLDMESDFEAVELGEDGADEVLVRLNNEELIAKGAVAAAGVAINWKNLTSANSDKVADEGVTLVTDYIWDAATSEGGTRDAAGNEAWASAITRGLSTLPGTSIEVEELHEIATLLDAGSEYKTFTKEDIRSLLEDGVIRFETDASGSVQNASIDLNSISQIPSNVYTFEISDDGVLKTNKPATISATGAEVSPEQHAGYAGDYFDGYMVSVDAFNTRSYSADSGSGWEAYATEASTELLAGANFMNSIFTTMKNVTYNLEQVGISLDASVADGTMTQAEADSTLATIESDLLDNFANKYNGELGLLGTGNEVDFASIEDVFAASLDLMTPGMDSLTSFMFEVSEAIPELQDAEKKTELINTIQFVGAIMVGIGVGAGGYMGAGKQLLGAGGYASTGGLTAANYIENAASVIVATGVNIGTIGSFGIGDTAEFATSGGISEIEAGLNETWQDLVDKAGSGSAFEAASLGYADAYRNYSDMIVDHWPDGYTMAGEQVYNPAGTAMFRTFEGGLNDEGSYGEVQGMIDALKARAEEINTAAASAGQNIRYEVIHTPAVDPSNYITGDPGDTSQPYYEEGSFVSVRVMRDPVVEAGGTPDDLYEFDVTMNIDRY
ncbi:MAG: hypothetical protein ABJO27_22270 [Pseudoruegeria sp.]